jgi:GNAT superfamily N-acetyltransferase
MPFSRTRRPPNYPVDMTASPNPYTIRPAEPSDAATIARHRSLIFRDMGDIAGSEVEAICSACIPWLQDLFAKQEYAGWLVLHEKDIIGGGGILLRETGPAPGCNRIGRWGHIANIYIDPGYRRRGLARLLMQHILQWAKVSQLDRITLTPSGEGRPLYESLGFVPAAEMQLPN